jgi:ABC-type lipopolysaccharide export system ATPase subunit
MFSLHGQFFIITIENKKILYWDRLQGELWGGSLQYLPQDASVRRKIDMSRNRIPANFKDLLEIKKEELDEFNNAKDDDELKELVLRDAKNNGCKLISEKII